MYGTRPTGPADAGGPAPVDAPTPAGTSAHPVMTTRIALSGPTGGRARLDVAGGALSCRRLPDEDGTVRVALVATQALLLAGDHVRIELDVAPGLVLEVVEITGTVAYDMQGGRASWDVDVQVGAGALLVWDALPFVVATGADVTRSARVELAEGAVAVLRETFVLGRTGEAGGLLTTSTHARLAGRPLLVETLTVSPESRRDPALLGGARCLDTVTVLGARYEDDAPAGADVLQLDRPGTLVRTFGTDAHRGDLAVTVTRARAAVSPSVVDVGSESTAVGGPAGSGRTLDGGGRTTGTP
ncbi:urease accessory protein UreD [Cellulomonas xiejunii]|uniref:urease accessory protein UreD n=1 Tax=Cellulomonas xiejunii TaxID=2968083 RepID=UPI001D0E1975|nr:urease accessory protein UreD [Cellulomonas xiejunii]MCC2313810.1 urease accessory protein UreD [Cellulomonas xiejunii]